MSESEDGGPGRREVAHRLFAAEFDDAEFSYSESDEERAPNYVVTPTGARVNRLFVVGVLTELEQVNEEVLRARIVDPTGPFVVYAGQYQPEALAFLEGATPPLFVAVTGKARTFEPEDSDRVFTSIRPESISEVDAETRDRWVVQAAQQTVDRVGRMASAKASELTGDALQAALVSAGVGESDAAGVTLALDYYGTTGEYLEAVRTLALDSARVVAGERDEAGQLSLSPGDGTDDPLATLATMELDAAAASTTPDDTDDVVSESTETQTATPADASDASDTPDATDPADASDASEATDTADASDASEATDTADAPETTASEVSTDTTATAEPDDPDSTSDSLGDFDTSDGDADAGGSSASNEDDVGEFDAEFDLDEDEREEIEQEYGTDFQSGTEVDDAGEADIETPDPEELAEMEADAADEPAGQATTDTADATADDAGEAEDVDLEDAVMAAMKELDDGGGADREAVVADVVDQYGADREAVADAIQDALMGGRCYEPDDGKLTPI